MNSLLDSGSLTLLARKWHGSELHLASVRLMHSVQWPDLPRTAILRQKTFTEGRRVLERSCGLSQTAFVTLVGDISPRSFDIIPGTPLHAYDGLQFGAMLSTCIIEQPRHTVFKHTWDRQL